MALAKTIYTILKAGTTNGLTSSIWVGKMKRQFGIPGVQIDAIDTSIDINNVSNVLHAKNGYLEEAQIVPINVWSTDRDDADDIVDAIETDLRAAIDTTVNSITIRDAFFEGRGKWIHDKITKRWVRNMLVRIHFPLATGIVATPDRVKLTIGAQVIDAETSFIYEQKHETLNIMKGANASDPITLLMQPRWTIAGVAVMMYGAAGYGGDDMMSDDIDGSSVDVVITSGQTGAVNYNGTGVIEYMRIISDVNDKFVRFEYVIKGSTDMAIVP